jgi:transcription initiation factor TFIIIB Brf1 subunit/transcription initiation factor TFIIB
MTDNTDNTDKLLKDFAAARDEYERLREALSQAARVRDAAFEKYCDLEQKVLAAGRKKP